MQPKYQGNCGSIPLIICQATKDLQVQNHGSYIPSTVNSNKVTSHMSSAQEQWIERDEEPEGRDY